MPVKAFPKHVTFAEENQVYTLSPPTPSPSYSVSSLPSSSGPLTPSPLGQSPLRLPPVDGPTRIHPSLGFHPLNPPLSYDLSLPSTAVTTSTNPPAQISARILLEAATQPPVEKLVLKSPLPWTMTIRPTSHAFVTVLDVLEQLYFRLRTVVTEKEYAVEKGDSQTAIATAFHQRVNRDWQTAAVETKKGLKRIDFLKGHNRFMGLSSTKEGPHVWLLNVR